MKLHLTTLTLSLLIIGLTGCQEKNNETVTEEEFDIIGTVAEVSNHGYLLAITKGINEIEEQMWIAASDSTVIISEKEFEEIEFGTPLKVILTGQCEEPTIRICGAAKIVID